MDLNVTKGRRGIPRASMCRLGGPLALKGGLDAPRYQHANYLSDCEHYGEAEEDEEHIERNESFLVTKVS